MLPEITENHNDVSVTVQMSIDDWVVCPGSKKAKQSLAFFWADKWAGNPSILRATKRRALRIGGIADKAGELTVKLTMK